MFPSAKESCDDAHPTAFTFGGEKVEEVEHGSFPSTKVANGVESTGPIPMCLHDEMVPIPCEHESHLSHLSESSGAWRRAFCFTGRAFDHLLRYSGHI